MSIVGQGIPVRDIETITDLISDRVGLLAPDILGRSGKRPAGVGDDPDASVRESDETLFAAPRTLDVDDGIGVVGVAGSAEGDFVGGLADCDLGVGHLLVSFSWLDCHALSISALS